MAAVRLGSRVAALLAAACGAVATAALGAGAASAQEGRTSPTVETIKKRGELVCGVDTGIPGFAYQDNAG